MSRDFFRRRVEGLDVVGKWVVGVHFIIIVIIIIILFRYFILLFVVGLLAFIIDYR